MRPPSDVEGTSNKLKVKVVEIDNKTLKCKHLASGYELQAINRNNEPVQVGQTIMVEYRKEVLGGKYVLFDNLMEEMRVKVLDSQHLLSNDRMYVSVIMENEKTKQRIHSLIQSGSDLFASTSIIVTGDILNIKINNGALFSID